MRKQKTQKKHIISLIVLTSIFLALLYIPTIPTSADTSQGGVTIATTPVASEIEVYDSAAFDEADSLTPNDEMYLNFTITDPDLLANMTWVRIIVYDTSKAAWSDAVNQSELTRFYWVESTDTWNMTSDGATWAVNTGACVDPGTDNASATFQFTLVFTPGKTSYEETANAWIFNVTAMDDDSLEGYNTTVTSSSWPSTLGGPADWYGELSINSGATSYNFTATSAGGGNVSLYLIDAVSGTFLNFTVISNGIWDVSASATNWSKAAEWINIDAGDVQYINDDSSWDAGGEWTAQPLTQSPTVFWDGSSLSYNNTQEAGQVKDIYMRLSVPGGTTGGFWTQTLTVIVQNG